MRKHFLTALLAISYIGVLTAQSVDSSIGLKDAYRDYWRMGVSVNQWEVKAETELDNRFDYSGATRLDQTADYPLIAKHFGWVVPENCMKCEVIHPSEGVYEFTLGDQMVDKALANGQHIVGHCLIWHSQCPNWFFVDDDGKRVSPEVLRQRMRDHIFTILGHYKGRVEAWDVVNEAFEDDGSIRRSPFYEILGEDFIPLAFQYAHEADPTVELYYNDYSMYKPKKLKAVLEFFRPLIKKGLPIHGIGMQGHLFLDDQDYITLYDKAIQEIASLGLKSQFTELDLSVLPNPFAMEGANISANYAYNDEIDPYKKGLPTDIQEKADQFWIDFFTMLMRNKEHVLRINFWCLNDENSWRNDWPVKGRTEYATLFDRQSRPKTTVDKLIRLAIEKSLIK